MKFLFSIALIFAFVFNSFGAPLVLKVSKEVSSNEIFTLASLDTSKYKQIRVSVKFVRSESSAINSELKTLIDRLESGNISRAEYDTKRNEITEKISKESVSVIGLEDVQEIYLGGGLGTYTIDLPPSKISVKVSGAGKYLLYIWAQ